MRIEVELSFFQHPKTLKLKQLLRNPQAGYYVLQMWATAAQYHPHGTFESPSDCAHAAGWRGSSDRLVTAMERAGFIERRSYDGRDMLIIHDWEKHTGLVIQAYEAKKAAQRQKYAESRGIKEGFSSERIPQTSRKNSAPPFPSVPLPSSTLPSVPEETGHLPEESKKGQNAPPHGPQEDGTYVYAPGELQVDDGEGPALELAKQIHELRGTPSIRTLLPLAKMLYREGGTEAAEKVRRWAENLEDDRPYYKIFQMATSEAIKERKNPDSMSPLANVSQEAFDSIFRAPEPTKKDEKIGRRYTKWTKEMIDRRRKREAGKKNESQAPPNSSK